MITLPPHLLADIVEAAATCSLFCGALLLAKRRFDRTAAFALGFGLLVAGSHLAGNIWVDSFTSKQAALLHREQTQMRVLPAEWGAGMSPEQRAKSIILARIAFVDHGKLIEYVEESGKRVRFAPTEEDIQNRDTSLAATATFDELASWAEMMKFHWMAIAATALILGYCTGRYAVGGKASAQTG